MHSTSQSDLISFDVDNNVSLEQVISGGQDGADLAGITAAFDCGIKTGGHCPRFWRTSSGPNFDLRDKYQLQETVATNYQKRTGLNVKNSDGTIRFASNFGSAGEMLTLQNIQKYEKPHYDILLPLARGQDEMIVEQIISWLSNYNIRILNVAGNRDPIRYGDHYHATYFLLSRVFNLLQRKYD